MDEAINQHRELFEEERRILHESDYHRAKVLLYQSGVTTDIQNEALERLFKETQKGVLEKE